MNILQGVLSARSHIVFIIALLCGFATIYVVDASSSYIRQDAVQATADLVGRTKALPLAPQASLSEMQMSAARTAWRYFENNTDPATGLVNSTDGFPSTTMWDTGSFLAGLISAERLGLISRDEFDRRLSAALGSLARIELFDNKLPNKVFDVRTLAKSDYRNKPSVRGTGWSSIDIARFLVPLTAIVWNYPQHAAEAEAVVSRWDLVALVGNGELAGAEVIADKTVIVQEGRVGYEQYGAKALMLRGLDAFASAQVALHVDYQMVGDIPVPVDDRPIGASSPAFATSEPFLLDGVEFGFDTVSHVLASNVYRTQEQRFDDTGHLTAVTESHLSTEPYFGYATVWGGGEAWSVMTLTGERLDSKRTLSTKAAFAWDALFGTAYTARLLQSIGDLADPENGWMEGRYEIDGSPNAVFTANTNGTILVSLAFHARGPLLHSGDRLP
jgi:hypothetical protein